MKWLNLFVIFFRSLGLTITEHPKQGDTSQITINGKLSEKTNKR